MNTTDHHDCSCTWCAMERNRISFDLLRKVPAGALTDIKGFIIPPEARINLRTPNIDCMIWEQGAPKTPLIWGYDFPEFRD